MTQATALATAISDDLGTNSIVTIRLYGKLGAKFGRVHRMAVQSCAEAIRALSSQLPGFKAFLTQSKDMGLGYGVFYGKQNLDKEQLKFPVGKGQDIRIAPFVLGHKNGGWVNIILGVVLIVVGVVMNIYAPGSGAFLIKMGVGLIVGGIVQLLTPVPKGMSSKDRPENMPSYAFNGPINTQAQGNPVPVLYGRMKVGSAVISAGINAVDQAYVPASTVRAGSGGGGGGGAAPWHLNWHQQ